MHDHEAPVVILATAAAYAELSPDDRHFAAALERRGLTARSGVWDDPSVDWTVTSVVVRSTWDYFLRPTEFLAWAARVSAGTLLQNPLPAIAWNAHKGYLAALQRRGFSIIETTFARHGETVDLAALARARRWGDVVIKPAISAAAHETRHFSAAQQSAAQSHLDRLLASGDVMVQPHFAPLAASGELSVIFIGEEVSHGVRRRSALSNDDRGPEAQSETPPPDACRFAERVLESALGDIGESMRLQPLLYARVDIAERTAGDWVLLEIELIEPSLFFRYAPRAAEQMADVLLRRL